MSHPCPACGSDAAATHESGCPDCGAPLAAPSAAQGSKLELALDGLVQRVANGVVRWRWPIFLFFPLVSLLFGSRIPTAEVDPEVKHQLPAEYPALLAMDEIDDLFGGSEMVMVVVQADNVINPETLERVKSISKAMERRSEFDDVMSLFTLKHIRGQDGTMDVQDAVKRIPKRPAPLEPGGDAEKHAKKLKRFEERLAKLEGDLKSNEMVYGNVVAEDFSATAIIGVLANGVDDQDALAALEEVLEEHPGPEAVEIGGMPITRDTLQKYIKADLRRLGPMALAVMLLFLFVCFRQLRGVVLPFLVVIMSIMVGMGSIPLMGWKIQMVTVLLPVLLIAVANDYGIHVFARYQEDNEPGLDVSPAELARYGVASLFWPVVVTGITTIAGLLCLLLHIIVPAQQLGILAGLAVAWALAASLLFIPAALAILPRAKPITTRSEQKGRLGLLDRLLHRTAAMVAAGPRRVIAVTVVAALIISVGIFKIEVDTNPVSFFPEDDPLVIANNLINDDFGGSTTFSIVAEGDMKSPEVLRYIDDLEQHLAERPEVGQTSSLAKVIREMNEVMHDGDPAFDTIPDNRKTISEYFLFYSMSGDPGDFDRLVDFPYEHGQLTVRINDLRMSKILQVIDVVQEWMAANPGHPFTIVGGNAPLFGELVHSLVRGQILSLLISMLVIGLLVGLQFRSFVAGSLAVLVLALAMMLVFGLMGFLGIELSSVTAILSSLMIGVGVDYTIHFLWRFREERRAGLEPTEAVAVTLTTTGRGIVFNALSVVVGFAILLFSMFLPVTFFGYLVVVSVIACLFGALVLLPALCVVFDPRFVGPRDAATASNGRPS